jgi:hypothetical protein
MWLKGVSRLFLTTLTAVMLAHAQATKPLTNDDILDLVVRASLASLPQAIPLSILLPRPLQSCGIPE